MKERTNRCLLYVLVKIALIEPLIVMANVKAIKSGQKKMKRLETKEMKQLDLHFSLDQTHQKGEEDE